MEWISVEEKGRPAPNNPDDNGVFLVASTYGVRTAWIMPYGCFQDVATNTDEGCLDWNDNEYKVTHWMPLPELPQD